MESEFPINNLGFELSSRKMNNTKISIENNYSKEQQITQLKNQLKQKEDKIKDLEDKVKDLEDKVKDLEDKIKRYPFILEKNEYLMAIIFQSLDQKVHYQMICKNTDTINELVGKLYAEYPELSKSENYFFGDGKIINKYASLEKNKIKNGDIILVNKIDSSMLSNKYD